MFNLKLKNLQFLKTTLIFNNLFNSNPFKPSFDVNQFQFQFELFGQIKSYQKLFLTMSVCPKLTTFLLAVALVSWSQQIMVKRLGFYRKMSGLLMSTEFILKQISKTGLTKCLKLCLFDKKCISVAYGKFSCIMYVTDPRAQLDESSLIRTAADASFSMYVISTDIQIPCFVGNIAAYSNSDLEKCEFEEKVTDSKCSEWSEWNPIFESPCGENAKLLRSITHARNCTQSLFGGEDQTCWERWSQVPDALEVFTQDFDEAIDICGETSNISGQRYLFTDFFKSFSITRISDINDRHFAV